MCAICSDHAAAFFSASGPVLSQEAADGKTNVQSACSLNTVYIHSLMARSLRLMLPMGRMSSSVVVVLYMSNEDWCLKFVY
jgi:hypothetical protein